jgi:hypothetical protein
MWEVLLMLMVGLLCLFVFYRAPEAPINVRPSDTPKSGLKSAIVLASNPLCQTRVSHVTYVTCARNVTNVKKKFFPLPGNDGTIYG